MSGVRPETLELLIAILNADPSHRPLAGTGARPAAISLPSRTWRSRLSARRRRGRGLGRPPAREAPGRGAVVLVLQAEEGLALDQRNGTVFIVAVGGLAVAEAGRLARERPTWRARYLDALMGLDGPFGTQVFTRLGPTPASSFRVQPAPPALGEDNSPTPTAAAARSRTPTACAASPRSTCPARDAVELRDLRLLPSS